MSNKIAHEEELLTGKQHRIIIKATLELAVDVGALDERPLDGKLQLVGEGYDNLILFEHAEDIGNGLLIFQFHGVHKGSRYTLTMCSSDRPDFILFREEVLDTFIDNLTDSSSTIGPLMLASFPVVEGDEEAELGFA